MGKCSELGGGGGGVYLGVVHMHTLTCDET